MKRTLPFFLTALGWLLAWTAAHSAAEPAAEDLFRRRVQPMLQLKCLGCHGEEKKLRGGLDLRTRAAMLKGGDSGPALVPGNAEKSPLYQAILRTGDVVMPPKESVKLTAEETADLKKWIEAGAPWPARFAGQRHYEPADVWAYQPIARPTVPVLESDDIKTPIDAFIQQGLAAKGLKPAPLADRATLVRRAYFDLTGLPPTPEQIDQFVKDERPDALALLVDKLLASPHHGERMAQHWLDVVRYADTSGFANDYERPHAWRYRDYVVKSFNEDKPFDRFVIEQIAGDELDPNDPEKLIAVGFLRMGPWEHTAMSVAAVTRQLFLDDVTHSVGVTFLGQGLTCARCHDHKFDPVPTRDYYRIQAVFASTQFVDRPAPFQPWENTSYFDDVKADAKQHLGLPIKSLTDEADAKTSGMITGKRDAYLKLAQQRTAPKCFSVESGKADKVAILKGGALEAAGQQVTPGVLSAVFGSSDSDAGDWQRIPTSNTGRRLALARWIASPRNTLTARVIVNRVWQMHFGAGLVDTPNNFGKMGGRPSHPELLDWLATWFIDNGWSLKKLHRLIMTSTVYQQSGQHAHLERLREVDPKNRLLAYFPARRLTAEEMRDAMLAATGELNATSGGPPIFPEINWDVAIQPRHIMGGIAPVYQPSPRPGQRNRRTLYAFRYRGLSNPMLEVLNRPNSEMSCERRDETTVTPQVFALFNSQFAHDRALALARRVEREADEPAARVERAFQLAFGRRPTAAQKQACLEHLSELTEHHKAHPPAKRARPAKLVRTSVAEMTGQTFAWEETLDPRYVPDAKPWDVGPETRALAELCLVLLNANEFVYVY
ncbi:MAG: PSD1 and planctomycete cytochrome C domain-containing protein [Gemmataceae bacterium]